MSREVQSPVSTREDLIGKAGMTGKTSELIEETPKHRAEETNKVETSSSESTKKRDTGRRRHTHKSQSSKISV